MSSIPLDGVYKGSEREGDPEMQGDNLPEQKGGKWAFYGYSYRCLLTEMAGPLWCADLLH